MSKIQIITDSASDISKEMEQKYNLDVISYSIEIGDKTYKSRLDFDNDGFYEIMYIRCEMTPHLQVASNKSVTGEFVMV